MFGGRIKLMWEEQLADPPIDYVKLITYDMGHGTFIT